MFEVLDPSPGSKDYLQRVEPSVQGGKKMATYFLDMIESSGTSNGGGVKSSTYSEKRSSQNHFPSMKLPSEEIERN